MESTTDGHTRIHLLGQTAETLTQWMSERGHKPYRAKQVLEWVYKKAAVSFDQMTNLGKDMRTDLAAAFDIYVSEVVREQTSSDGTIKQLLRWPDGETCECVLIPERDRRTACISSQVGCPVQCVFCASGVEGLRRSLTAGEIVEQAMRIHGVAGSEEDLRRNIVLMGSGEPLLNYDAVLQAILILKAEWGMHLGARRITISTVGLPKQIRRLADEGMEINLAISLHAATDDLRQELIPWSRKISIAEILEAAQYYFEKTGREITFEYLMIRNRNMRSLDAERIARIARTVRCNVNLIPYNAVDAHGLERPDSDSVKRFAEMVRHHGVNAHVRRSRGLDIDAACGQLRRRVEAES